MGDNVTIEGEIFSFATFFGNTLSFKVKKACEAENQTITCNNISYNATNHPSYGAPVIPNPDIAGIGASFHTPSSRTSN